MCKEEKELRECCWLIEGRPCKIPADRQHNGTWYCHVHDPEGQCQVNIAAMRAEKQLAKYGEVTFAKTPQQCQPFDYVKVAGRFFVCLPDYPVTITRSADSNLAGIDPEITPVSPAEVDPDRALPLFEPPTEEQAKISKRRQSLQTSQAEAKAASWGINASRPPEP